MVAIINMACKHDLVSANEVTVDTDIFHIRMDLISQLFFRRCFSWKTNPLPWHSLSSVGLRTDETTVRFNLKTNIGKSSHTE